MAPLTSLSADPIRRTDIPAGPAEQVRLLESNRAVPAFTSTLEQYSKTPLVAEGLDVLQINLGKLCNQTCRHCHVDAGPDRTEIMSRETMEDCLRALAAADIPTVDLTGGAPELNPQFRWFVEECRRLDRHVIDRCNLSVLLIQGQKDLGEFLARNHVEIIASLPYYLEEETDAQRGDGVFRKSIQALRLLNSLGYGAPDGARVLNLVYNPVGAYLPPSQDAMERAYRRELRRRHQIEFNHLYTLTNMPISRYLEYLLRSGNYETYMEKLVRSFNPAAVEGLMCRSMLSVSWDGRLYDCDFNQMLDLSTRQGLPAHISRFQPEALRRRAIVTGRHCYGCTAGAGSSCGGATTAT
ncbi:MAG: arsenosugar biosynthesis radical SAM (seleno)protein ArsS [Acidobacteriota bacterium]